MARTRLPLDLARAQALAAEGHTEAEIARQLGVSQDTLTRRKQDSADFADALKRGQASANSTVSNALYKQAKKGNVAAIIWWEKTRLGYSDSITHKGDPTAPVYIFETVAASPVAPATDGVSAK